MRALLLLVLWCCVPLVAGAQPGAGTGKTRGKKKAAPVRSKAAAVAPAVHAPVPPPPQAPAPPALPTAPAPQPTSPAGYRALEARGDLAAGVDQVAGAAAEVPAPSRIHRLRLTPRVGVLIPRQDLQPGFLVGAEAGFRLPVLDDRLRISLGAGYSLVTFKGPRLVAGRGVDPAFLQNTTLVPIELLVTGDLLDEDKGGPLGLSVGVGYGLYWSSSSMQDFDRQVTDQGLSSAFVAALRASKRLGPGAVLVDVRYAEAGRGLGQLSGAAVETLSGFSFCAGYAFDLL